VLVCSVAASALWLHRARSADHELATLPLPPVLVQALGLPYDAGDTAITDATENDDTPTPSEWTMISASDAHARSPVAAAPPTRVVGATTPPDGRPSSPVSAPLPVEVDPLPLVTTAPIVAAPAGTEAGSGDAAAAESGGAEIAASVSDEDRSGIERTLERYQRAYRELDAPAAAAVWPTVDARALRRAFASVQEQNLVFRRCDIATTPDAATAHCVGELSYVRRVGDTTRRAEHHTWTIRLLRSGKEWSVVGLSAQ
jgi:hypothetical protein